MNRRDWLKTASLTSAALAISTSSFKSYAADQPAVGASAAPAQLETEIKRLKLRHTWTTTMSSSEFRDTLHVRYTRDGITGYGEGAPIVRYHENAADAQKALESVREFLLNSDPWQFRKNATELFRRIDGQFAAKAAIDIAWMDWIGKKLNVPLYRFLGLDPNDTPVNHILDRH